MPTAGFPEGYVPTQIVWAMFVPVVTDAPHAGSQGVLCTIVPQSPGQLSLVLWMGWYDFAEQEVVTMTDQFTLTVE